MTINRGTLNAKKDAARGRLESEVDAEKKRMELGAATMTVNDLLERWRTHQTIERLEGASDDELAILEGLRGSPQPRTDFSELELDALVAQGLAYYSSVSHIAITPEAASAANELEDA